jgi:lysophospholipase L1-like esterase
MKKTIKMVVFSLAPLIFLLIFIEVSLRLVAFQLRGPNAFALQSAYDFVKDRAVQYRLKYELKKSMEQLNTRDEKDYIQICGKLSRALYTSEGRSVLKDFHDRYTRDFDILFNEANVVKAKLLILYIPSENYGEKQEVMQINRAFFRGLAEKHGLDFIDMTDEFMKYPVDMPTLLPENSHLSRFGNQLVARELAEYINKYSAYRANHSFIDRDRPKLLGDLKPKDNTVWNVDPNMPYRVTTNSVGLRMSEELSVPKKKQRILFLGDSFTFGPYLKNSDTFPGLLSHKFPDKEFLNAGVAGYNIEDEKGLFIERAKYTESDLIILQVLDNDISDYFFFKRNFFNRQRKVYEITETEKELLSAIRKTQTVAP